MIRNHFTATGIVFNHKNEILMIHHNSLCVWLPPGGHIDENELPENAVLREIFEETGIKAKIIPIMRGIKSCGELALPFTMLLEDIEGNGTHNHIDMIYLCNAINEDFIPQEKEISGIGWFSFDKIKELKTFDNVKETITKAIEYLNEKNSGVSI